MPQWPEPWTVLPSAPGPRHLGRQSGTLCGMESVLRYRECAICRAGHGGGAWIPSGRLGRDQPGERHSIEGTRLQLMAGDCCDRLEVFASDKGDRNAQSFHRLFRRGGGRHGSREREVLGNLTITQVQGDAQATSMVPNPKEVSTSPFRIWDDGVEGLNSRQGGVLGLVFEFALPHWKRHGRNRALTTHGAHAARTLVLSAWPTMP